MNIEERKNRVVARGEHSGHSHIVIGDATVKIENSKIIITTTGYAWIKHLMETPFVESGKEVWTKEHEDIKLPIGEYEYIQQVEYDPYQAIIREVYD